MRKNLLIFLVDAAATACLFLMPHPGYSMAVLPIVAALITAAAAAAGGIASGVQAGQAAKDQASSSAEQRAMQMKLAKMQIAAQREQQARDQQQAAQQTLASVYGERANTVHDLAQRQTAANGDAMGTLAKAYFRGRG